jgi:DNA polymerase
MIQNKKDVKRELLFTVRSLRSYIQRDINMGRSLSYLKRGSEFSATETPSAPVETKSIRTGISTHGGDEHHSFLGDLSPQGKSGTLEMVRNELGDCQRCPLGRSRRNLVFGEGNPNGKIVFVGEAPGADEDDQGRPFVGRAGQLLTRIISAMKLSRDDVYICNILKCRPPANRNPVPDEIRACEPFLVKQIQAINPEVICALGTFAAKTLLKTDVAITVLRGRFHSYHGIALMPTYHPAYLLRNPGAKKPVWEDMQMVMKRLEENMREDSKC